ncbi:MAG: hypothetical protein PHZ16_05255 [Eubacteriales bacterium]|nr:hypothetical protein [Eubacteriales bacterium]
MAYVKPWIIVQNIVSRLLYRIALVVLLVFAIFTVVSLLLIVKNWNRLTLTFVGMLAVLLLALIIVALM